LLDLKLASKGTDQMICPVCKKNMTEEDFGGVNVDVCRDGCKGMWFDWFELSKLDESNEGLGDALQEALQFPRVNDENRGQINCPKCGLLMHRHPYMYDKGVTIDECYKCGGIFLDSGELTDIRMHHMSEQDEAAYVQKLINQAPSEQRELIEEERLKQRSDAIAHLTRFMRVSYLITGK
jgi:Zn-finger nucleic acid-binding protein